MLCLLSALLLCSRCVAYKYGSISRFKGVFRGFYGVRVGLCCLRALRGLWGFCVRERLGGFGAWCVFAPVFHLLPLVLSFCPAFLLSVFLPLFVLFACLVCSCVLVAFVVVSFSLAVYTQKERAQRFCPLRPLFVCRECSDSCNVIEELRGRCFGSF